jgi:hypothetical protein
MSGKNVGIRIRVEEELRTAFQSACLAEQRQASDVLREFMRAFADQHSGGLQASLFAALDVERVSVARAGKTPGSKRNND